MRIDRLRSSVPMLARRLADAAAGPRGMEVDGGVKSGGHDRADGASSPWPKRDETGGQRIDLLVF